MITLLVHVVLAGLVVFGLSELITIEEGPFAIFERARVWLGGFPEVPYPVESMYDANDTQTWFNQVSDLGSLHSRYVDNDMTFKKTLKGTLYGILDCAYCSSVWIAFAITGLFVLHGATVAGHTTTVITLVLQGVCIFGGSIAVQRILKKQFGVIR